MRNTAAVITLACALSLAGCATQTPPPSAATQPAPEAPTENNPLPNEWTMTTSLAPSDAMQTVADLFGKLGFTEDTVAGMWSGQFAHDYFSANLSARTADGHDIRVNAEWLADGKTLLTTRSNLPEAQNAYLAGKIRGALNTPMTQP
ncbi:MAG TPA: hypothetical protein VM008_13570 [Phycisphaerae bacterium]|nr:hypothetical protein [Phycisphaerae bacterium]